MALNDFSIYNPCDDEYTFVPIVASGAVATINAGEPTKAGSAGGVVPMIDGDGTTTQRFAGLAKSTSTDTVAAAGTVVVWIPLPGLIYSGKAKSSTAANTLAKIQALFYKRVVFDLTTGVWTVDSAAGDSASNGVTIVGGDQFTNTLYFTVCLGTTILGNVTN